MKFRMAIATLGLASGIMTLLSVVPVMAQVGTCFCGCYYSSNCPGGQQCNRTDFCFLRLPHTKPLFCPEQADPESTAGPCDGLCSVSHAGSVCGMEEPRNVAAVHAAWTKAYDRAGNTGGGRVGPFTTPAHHLAHKLIGSAQCRTILAQSALDLQEVCRSAAFLEHPEESHRADDHRVVDISKDECARKIGPLCEKVVTAYIMRRPRLAELFLQKIPLACPSGQGLGGRCEGARDEIACLGAELHSKALFLTTSILETESCGNGVIDPGEQCEHHTDCGLGTPLDYCVGCSCFTFGCI